jgi:hypothetical protein
MELVLSIVGLLLAVASLPFLSQWVTKLARRSRQRQKGAYCEPNYLARMSPVERFLKDRLYYYPGGWASAVRLWGADADYVTLHRMTVTYSHTELVVPPEISAQRDAIIQRRRRDAEENGSIFFNGPNTRLIDWRANASEAAGVAREKTCIELRLGPVGWYDYEYLNDAFRGELNQAGLERVYEYYLKASDMLRDGSVRGSKLSNILDNAVVLVTIDGFVGYQERSGRVATVPGRLTSAVAENTNRYLDDVDSSSLRPIHEEADSEDTHETPGNDYVPMGTPHPFFAAMRGIGAEISPRLRARIGNLHLKLLGLSFDLEALHPDALYAAFIDLSHRQALEWRRRWPGKEHIEGTLRFTPATFDSDETLELLADQRWIPAGKAALVRTIELLEAVQTQHKAKFPETFRFLRDAE